MLAQGDEHTVCSEDKERPDKAMQPKTVSTALPAHPENNSTARLFSEKRDQEFSERRQDTVQNRWKADYTYPEHQ